ncbi:amidohydrolase family protein [Terriglobus roseus]|uniref:amidohydrolase family protein n=1 Tax=Terriglobus roseus TaxID=392734 RepID=UPI0012F704DB|nr:amidohydrolase family protein [Terriglobus roseus]
MIRPAEGLAAHSVIEVTGDRISAIYTEDQYPDDEPTVDVRGKFIMAGLTDSLSEMSTQCEADEAIRYGVTSVVATAGLDRGAINLSLNPSPVIYPMALIKSRGIGGTFTLDQLDEQVSSALQNSDGVKFVDLNKDMNASQMAYLLPRLREDNKIRINAELASAAYRDAVGVHNLLHTEWYFDPLAPDSIRDLPDLQTNASSLLNFYRAVDGESSTTQEHSKFLVKNFFLTPALGLYSFHDFATFAAFSKYYEERNTCGIPMTRVSESVYTNYANNQWAESLYALERANKRNGARYLAASANPRFGTLPGLSLLNDLYKMKEVLGLTNDEALATATVNFDRAYGLKSVGRVQPGYYANLLILNRNPQEDLRYLQTDITAVVLRGQLSSR